MINLQLNYMDYEAVAALRYGGQDDGKFQRATVLCKTYYNLFNGSSSICAANAITSIKRNSYEACEVVDKFLWRHS